MMKDQSSVWRYWLLLTFSWGTLAQAQVPERIAYQGKLLHGTNLVNGSVGLSLRLWQTETGGTIPLYEDSNAVSVVDGLYAAFLGDHTISGDLDSALSVEPLWLEVAINGVALAPRERIGSVGYARIARRLGALRVLETGGTPSLVGGDGDNDASGVGVVVAGGGGPSTERNAAYSSYSVIGGGKGNSIASNMDHAVISGGADNEIAPQCWYGTIGGGEMNKLETNAAAAVIAGGSRNRISRGGIGSVIAGGSYNQIDELAQAATIGGGTLNRIGSSAPYGVVAGGESNKAYGGWSAIGGGQYNYCDAWGAHATIGGGYSNRVDAQAATVAGGFANTIGRMASGSAIGGGAANVISSAVFYATIPGGHANEVSGHYGFAAGFRAKSRAPGAFVWADSQNFDFIAHAATDTNKFLVRATGGVMFFTGIDGAGFPTSGVMVAAGSGTWTSWSDRHSKHNFEEVDPRDILERLAQVPITRWTYNAQDDRYRHIGPVAQDFNAAFGVGDIPHGISMVDADGVALAAIQGLYSEVSSQKSEVSRLQAENAELKARLDRLENLLGAQAK